LEGAIKNSVDGLVAECGGACICATCHVYVDEKAYANLPALSPTEDQMLDAVACTRRPTSRLSCQVKATEALDGAIIQMPERQT
jgi:2Fe-2S ferredoxin